MAWERIGYALLCVIVPMAWGLLVVWISNRIEKAVVRQDKAGSEDGQKAEMPPLEYHI